MSKESPTPEDAKMPLEAHPLTREEVATLTGVVQVFGDQVIELKKHRLHLTYAIAAVVVALSLVVGWIVGVNNPRITRLAKGADKVAIVARDASSATAKLKEADYTRCLTGNEYRTADRALWTYLIDQYPAPATPAAQERLNKFNDFLDSHDKLRVCVKPQVSP